MCEKPKGNPTTRRHRPSAHVRNDFGRSKGFSSSRKDDVKGPFGNVHIILGRIGNARRRKFLEGPSKQGIVVLISFAQEFDKGGETIRFHVPEIDGCIEFSGQGIQPGIVG